MDVERLIARLRSQKHIMQADGLAALLETTSEAASALAKLQADNKAWEVALNSERELWNTISDQLEASVAKLHAERDEAWEALRPFAEASRDCDDDLVSDGCSAWESSEANCVTIGHFRAASRALGGGE